MCINEIKATCEHCNSLEKCMMSAIGDYAWIRTINDDGWTDTLEYNDNEISSCSYYGNFKKCMRSYMYYKLFEIVCNCRRDASE